MSDTEVTAPDTGEDPPPPPGGDTTFVADPGRGRLAVAGMVAGTLLLLVALALVVLLVLRAGEVLPGVSVAGRDVGGLSAAEVRTVVTEVVEDRRDATVEVTVNDATETYVPGEAGYHVDVDAVVDEVVAQGRDGVTGYLGDHIAATFGARIELDVPGDASRETVEAFVDDLADRIDRPVFDGAVTADPATLAVDVEEPRTGFTVDRDGLVSAIVERVGTEQDTAVTAGVDTTPSPISTDEAVATGADAERLLAAPVTLTANGSSLTLAPADLARLLVTEVADDELVLRADAEVLAGLVEPARSRLETSPRSATYELVSGLRTFDDQGSTTFTPSPADLRVVAGADGSRVDTERLADQLGDLFESGTTEAAIDLEVVPPDTTDDELATLTNPQLIGTFTTYHACCANRVVNIQRLADLVRGQVLEPTETFSVNDFVGQRTLAKGFVADGAIVQGEIVDEVGGGISQFATTMYNASFFAGIPILDHREHSLYISRYPRGREATLNYDSIDLEIANDTEFPLFLHTSYTGTSITVSIFGDNGGRRVTAVMGEPQNFRPVPTRTRNNPNLRQGARRTVQTGFEGYDVRVVRVIEQDGERREEVNVANYLAKPTIIEIGTGAAPPPPPPPSPEPEPEPEPQPEPQPSESQPEPEPEPTPSES